MMTDRLPREFYLRDNVLTIARDMLGKELISFSDGRLTSGIITEAEAYNGIIDRASHTYGDRRTKRTETMYSEGGVAYIYLCYGIHSLLNAVTNIKDVPHAVLIRAILPYRGTEVMEERLGRQIKPKEGQGPGKVTKLLGLTFTDDGEDLVEGNRLWIANTNIVIPDSAIQITPRIGVAYAGEDALLPYRFVIDLNIMLNLLNGRDN
jgi:DNA-3-methyladenine glycosylase